MPEFVLPRQRDAVASACDAVASLSSAAGWPDVDVTRLVLVLGEVVGNAVEHGQGDKSISMTMHVGSETIEVTIEDGGGGPTSAQIREASLPDSLSATGGRGLYMIRELSDDVRVEAGGAVWLQFRRRS